MLLKKEGWILVENHKESEKNTGGFGKKRPKVLRRFMNGYDEFKWYISQKRENKIPNEAEPEKKEASVPKVSNVTNATETKRTQSEKTYNNRIRLTFRQAAEDFNTTEAHIREVLSVGFKPLPQYIGEQEQDFLLNVLTSQNSVKEFPHQKQEPKTQSSAKAKTEKDTSETPVATDANAQSKTDYRPDYRKGKTDMDISDVKTKASERREENIEVIEKNADLFMQLLNNGNVILLDASFLLNQRLNVDLYKKLMTFEETSGKILLLPGSVHELEKQLTSPYAYLRFHAVQALKFFESCTQLVCSLNNKYVDVFGDMDILLTLLLYRSKYSFAVFTNDTALAKDVLLMNQLNSYNGWPAQVYKLNTKGMIQVFRIKQDDRIPGVTPTKEKTPRPAVKLLPDCLPSRWGQDTASHASAPQAHATQMAEAKPAEPHRTKLCASKMPRKTETDSRSTYPFVEAPTNPSTMKPNLSKKQNPVTDPQREEKIEKNLTIADTLLQDFLNGN